MRSALGTLGGVAGVQGLSAWARQTSVPTLAPADYPGVRSATASSLLEKYAFTAGSPCVDYGRAVERVPQLVLAPRTLDELRAVLAACGDHEVALKLRGASHSSGGQSLISDGVQVDLRGLSKIVVQKDSVTTEAGAFWLSVVEALVPSRQRPPVLTDNPRTTVGGTLAVGGFGDSSHREGLQANQVLELQLATLDGGLHRVGPGDPLFDYALCGRGQLGVIASATMRTVNRPWLLQARLLEWHSFERFLPDAVKISEHERFDYFRAKLRWDSGSVWAIAGDFGAQAGGTEGLHPNSHSEVEEVDFLTELRRDRTDELNHVAPCLELVFSQNSALRGLTRVIEGVRRHRLGKWLAHDSSLMMVKRHPGLPLAPLPGTEGALVIAIRPRMGFEEAMAALPSLEEIGRNALDEGARIYLMSIEVPHPEFLDRQFGEALAEFRALKQRWDPRRLLNPGLL
jgi:FAD/FMN-containing dehydrogenase